MASDPRRSGGVAQEAYLALRAAADHVGRLLAERCARHALTPEQLTVLRLLRGAHPEGQPRYEIAVRMPSRAPDATRLLDRLERRGLVERVRSRDDRRLSISRITARGLRVLAELDGDLRELERDFAARLSEGQMKELARLCRAVGP
ncbi:MAG: MarR family winged helix-turn-helix transcriptional regulator [Gemmatimonadales bacterium]